MMAVAGAAMLLGCEREPEVTVNTSEGDEMQKKDITFTFGDSITVDATCGCDE